MTSSRSMLQVLYVIGVTHTVQYVVYKQFFFSSVFFLQWSSIITKKKKKKMELVKLVYDSYDVQYWY